MKPKFRVWNKKTESFIDYGDLMLDLENAKVYAGDVGIPEYTIDVTKQVVLMQSTGLKDQNGVEIFEGDIVHLTSDEGIDYNALIVFKDGGFCAIDGAESNYGFRRYDLSRFDLYLDVIGNVHENIELLEAAE